MNEYGADVQAEAILLCRSLWGRCMDTLDQALFGYCQDGMITKICWNESERAGYSSIVIKIAFKLKGRQETSNVGSAVEGIFLIMFEVTG